TDLHVQVAGPRGAAASRRWDSGGAFPETPRQKYRCRVGRAVTHPGPSPDPDERISRIRLFRRCGSWLHLSTTLPTSRDQFSNVSPLGMVLWVRSPRHPPPVLGPGPPA